MKRPQEQSFCEVVEPDFTDKIFWHDQLYMGLSRVTPPDNLKIGLPLSAEGLARNVVFSEAVV